MTVDDGLRPIFRQHLPQLMWTSIETGGTGLGVPDSHYLAPARLACPQCRDLKESMRMCYCAISAGAEGMIEYKRTDGWAVDLRPEQVAYLTRRARLGGRAFVGVRRRHAGGPRRGPPVDALHLFPGSLAREALAGGLRCPALQVPAHHVWPGGPSRWPWTEVLAALLAQPSR